MRPSHQNPRTTPLAGPRPPQNPKSGNGNGLGIRHDGFVQAAPPVTAPARGKSLPAQPGRRRKKPLPEERVCAYQACRQTFAPKRPNQFYHSGNCRKFAHQQRLRDTGDAAARLVSALEAVAAAPDQPYQSHDQMWAKILQLSDRAESALKFWKSQVDHRSKK